MVVRACPLKPSLRGHWYVRGPDIPSRRFWLRRMRRHQAHPFPAGWARDRNSRMFQSFPWPQRVAYGTERCLFGIALFLSSETLEKHYSSLVLREAEEASVWKTVLSPEKNLSLREPEQQTSVSQPLPPLARFQDSRLGFFLFL